MTTNFDTHVNNTLSQEYDTGTAKQQHNVIFNSKAAIVDSIFKDPPHAKNERSDSYSSVREERDGFPQSFIVSSKQTTESGIECGNNIAYDETAIAEDLTGPTESFLLPPKNASLGSLPAEILENILGYLILDVPPTEYTPRNRDLMSCLLTSKALCASTVRILYQQVTFPHSHTFSKFMHQLRTTSDLGSLVRRLDLSHFTSLGMGRTKQLNKEIQNMTSRSLLECLKAMPRVREVLLQEHVDQDVDTYVLLQLLYELPKLEALDLCASSTANFAESFTNAVSRLSSDPSLEVNIQRLGLHECFTLQSHDIELLISRMPYLTILDLHHTRITDQALALLPPSAPLTHLNLGRCPSLTAPGVLAFLQHHPSAASLIWLNISCDPSRWRLFDEASASTLLPHLPPTLRSLNLSGAKLSSAHIPLLLPLTKHLEELSLAHTGLGIDAIARFFARPEDPAPDPDPDSPWSPSTLHYLDLTGLAGVTQPSIFAHANQLLSEQSLPLEVVEVSAKVATGLLKTRATNRSLGWTVRELGRRSWYVRERIGLEADSGGREWKMGSRWWGMRKVPVAWSEVGGLFGHYMFKT